MLALTLYKVLQFHNGIPKHSRSKLVDAFWIDGTLSWSLSTPARVVDAPSSGIINFSSMLRESFFILPPAWFSNRTRIVLGILNIGLVLKVSVSQIPLLWGWPR